jgi:hypothetical protein
MRILTAAALAASTILGGAAAMTTSAYAQSGSYQASCRNVQTLPSGYIGAECADTSGRFRYSRIQYTACQGDIVNNNGLLVCTGAQTYPGDYVTPPVTNNNRDRDRNNTGTVAGAGALGVIAGALLGQNLYQGSYNYPDYGQRGYGDPRYDPRFAEGGWGYGSRPGQFVAISRRTEWLDRRIDEGQRRGTLSRREANDLRDELDDLTNLERRYSRNGLSRWEMSDLDNRFDALAARIRFEQRDYNNRPGGNYGGGYNNGGYNNGGYGGGYNTGGYDRRY